MAAKLTYSHRFTTVPKRVNHVELFNAKALQMPGADPTKKSFQMQWIFEKDDADLKELVTQATVLLMQVSKARQQPLKNLVAGKDFHWPFQSGENFIERTRVRAAKRGKEYDAWEDHCEGKVVLMTKADEAYPPELFGPVNGKFVHFSDESVRAQHRKDFYRGMYALGAIVLVGFDSSEKSWGVTAFVNEVCATGKGERIGGGNTDASVYGTPTVTGVVSDFDPTGGAQAPGWDQPISY